MEDEDISTVALNSVTHVRLPTDAYQRVQSLREAMVPNQAKPASLTRGSQTPKCRSVTPPWYSSLSNTDHGRSVLRWSECFAFQIFS